MTGHEDERAVPGGPPRRRRDTQIAAIYFWMLILSLSFAILAWQLWAFVRHTNHTATVNCHHSKVLAPALGAGFLRTGILTETQLKSFKSTLPRSC